MAYLVFTTPKGREIGRRSLQGSVVIGRAPDCEICVHDILLSRRHVQLELEESGWVVTDLASRNGTYLNGQEIGRHLLTDGEALRMGKTVITFCAGKLSASRGGAAMSKPNRPRLRPADPFESLTATVCGFDFAKSLAERNDRLGAKPRMSEAPQQVGSKSSLPTPQPMPRDPAGYDKEDVYALLSEIASSSWDSIYMNASRPAPTRPAPRPLLLSSRHPRTRTASPTADLSLQATTHLVIQAPPPKPPAAPAPHPKNRFRRALLSIARGLATLGQSVVVMGIVHLGKR